MGTDNSPYIIQGVRTTLDVYCEWLNMWAATDEGQTHRYAPRQFMVYNPDEHLYGSYQVQSITPVGWYELWVIAVSDGDEGGPATLTVWIDEYGKVVHLVQEFDTSIQSIYDRTSYHPEHRPNVFLSTP